MACHDVSKLIHNMNLSYLLLAQRLYASDPAIASFRLGMQERTLEIVSKLMPDQLIKLAESSQILFQFRLDDAEILKCVTEESRVADLQNIHVGILLSTQLLDSLKKSAE